MNEDRHINMAPRSKVVSAKILQGLIYCDVVFDSAKFGLHLCTDTKTASCTACSAYLMKQTHGKSGIRLCPASELFR